MLSSVKHVLVLKVYSFRHIISHRVICNAQSMHTLYKILGWVINVIMNI